MYFILKIISVYTVCGVVWGQNTTYDWKKEVLDLQVRESALFYQGSKGQTLMLMSSDDAQLRNSPFPQSTSLHDFKPDKYLKDSKRIGTLAIKIRKTCFIGDIPRDAKDIETEAKQRSDSASPIQNTSSKSRYTINQKSKITFKELLGYSYDLAKFCSNAKNVYILLPMDQRVYPYWRPWWPWWPFCFWAPIIVFPDFKEPITI